MSKNNGLKVELLLHYLLLPVAAALVSKNKKNAEQKKTAKKVRQEELNNFRNTERGKNAVNSKGIYYSNGNYEAFARPLKPEGVDHKNAYLVGSGLASLAAACFLVRDGQMPGSHIHIFRGYGSSRRCM